MTIRFAASARPTRLPRIARRRPANDNAARDGCDAVLKAALRHFAVHGLAAAAHARGEAEAAHVRGDAEGYEGWLAICRTLDRPMARGLARAAGQRGGRLTR